MFCNILQENDRTLQTPPLICVFDYYYIFSSGNQDPPNYPTGRIITPHNTYKCTICPNMDEGKSTLVYLLGFWLSDRNYRLKKSILIYQKALITTFNTSFWTTKCPFWILQHKILGHLYSKPEFKSWFIKTSDIQK